MRKKIAVFMAALFGMATLVALPMGQAQAATVKYRYLHTSVNCPNWAATEHRRHAFNDDLQLHVEWRQDPRNGRVQPNRVLLSFKNPMKRDYLKRGFPKTKKSYASLERIAFVVRSYGSNQHLDFFTAGHAGGVLHNGSILAASDEIGAPAYQWYGTGRVAVEVHYRQVTNGRWIIGRSKQPHDVVCTAPAWMARSGGIGIG